MLRELTEHGSVSLVPNRVGEMLDQVATAEDVEELEPTTDRERRQVALERRSKKRELARVSVCLGRIRPRVTLGAVRVGVDVDPAGEHEPVERVEGFVDGQRGRRHDEWTTTCPFDGLDVEPRHERSGQLPGAPLRGLRVRGDADERTAVHAVDASGGRSRRRAS